MILDLLWDSFLWEPAQLYLDVDCKPFYYGSYIYIHFFHSINEKSDRGLYSIFSKYIHFYLFLGAFFNFPLSNNNSLFNKTSLVSFLFSFTITFLIFMFNLINHFHIFIFICSMLLKFF